MFVKARLPNRVLVHKDLQLNLFKAATQKFTKQWS